MIKKLYWGFCILASLAFLFLVKFVLSSELILLDNLFGLPLYDFFLSIMAGYAFHLELSNDAFISPLGFLYHLINGLSFNLVERFSIGLNKMVFVAFLVFSCLLSCVYIAQNALTKYKTPYIFLLLIYVSLCSGTASFLVVTKNISWYGMHNIIAWGALYLQMFFAAMLFKDRDNLKQIQKSKLYALSFISSLFLYAAFNTKINYVAASGLLLLAIVPFLKRKDALIYLTSLACFFAIENLLTSALFHYDYFFYIRAIVNSLGTRVLMSAFRLAIYSLFFLALFCSVIFANNFSALSKNMSLKDKLFSLLAAAKRRKCLELIFFASINVLSVYICVLSNTLEGGRNFIIPLLIFWFVFLQYKNKRIVFFIICALYIVYASLTYVKMFSYEGKNYQRFTIDNNDAARKINFFYLPIGENSKTQINEKYTKYIPFLSVILNKDEYKAKGIKFIEAENKKFSEIIKAYKELELNKDDKLLLGGFINLAPFLTNSIMPQKAWHWGDITSKNMDDPFVYDLYRRQIQGADIIILRKEFIWDDYEKILKALIVNEGYIEFYESKSFEFYALKEWISKRLKREGGQD